MNPYIDAKKSEFIAAIDHFKQELARIRTGHANPELVEGIVINAYDSLTPIKQLATITVPEPKTIMIQPWDKSVLKDIEKGIVQANLGFNPVNDGEVIRVPMPPLSEDNRKDLVKLIKEKAEKARISLRQVRDKVKDAITSDEKEKEITEDDRFKYLKQLDEYTTEQTNGVSDLAKKKEEKIMTV